MDEDNPNFVDHNGSPVENSYMVDNIVEISSIEQSKLVAATTLKVGSPRSCKKEAASVSRGIY